MRPGTVLNDQRHDVDLLSVNFDHLDGKRVNVMSFEVLPLDEKP
jgi:hypothetical protein